MPIDFTCPHCQTRTVVADEFAGQSGPCANCGQVITVPSVGMAPPPSRVVSSGKSTGAMTIGVIGGALFGLVVCGGLIYALLIPAFGGARQAALRSQCANNLKQIGLAMHSYHETYDKLPPAYQVSPDGKRMHSWRLLIMPFLESNVIYDSYDQEQAWDSPANKRVQSMMSLFYQCSSAPPGGNVTDYVVVTGPETIFDGANAATFADITDGPSNTIMVVEAAGINVVWTEPRDLDFNQMSMAIGSQPGNCVHSHHTGGAHALMADGSVRFLKSDLSPNVLRALLTKAGGEVIGDF